MRRKTRKTSPKKRLMFLSFEGPGVERQKESGGIISNSSVIYRPHLPTTDIDIFLIVYIRQREVIYTRKRSFFHLPVIVPSIYHQLYLTKKTAGHRDGAIAPVDNSFVLIGCIPIFNGHPIFNCTPQLILISILCWLSNGLQSKATFWSDRVHGYGNL